MQLTTTLALLRQHSACTRGYNLIAEARVDDKPRQLAILRELLA